MVAKEISATLNPLGEALEVLARLLDAVYMHNLG